MNIDLTTAVCEDVAPVSALALPALNVEQQRSQISSGHRLIALARKKRFYLYSQDEFASKAIRLSADYWLDHFAPALRTRMNEAMAQRINATIARARKHSHQYGVKKPGPAEFVAEALFDNWWFKAKEQNLSRTALRDHIQESLKVGRRLRLHLPILSRKPFSPIKNRGPYPDLAEIHTLARCAEAAQVIKALSPTGCEFVILADGFKYNRACQTPDTFVTAYQEGLRFWIDHLDVGDIVTLVDYEDWVQKSVPTTEAQLRTLKYEHYCKSLIGTYGPLFDPADVNSSLCAIQNVDDVGMQLGVTFWSIVTSAYYEDLFALSPSPSLAEQHYGEQVQQAYVAYVSSLHRRLDRGSFAAGLHPANHFASRRYTELFHGMRRQAWEAAVRYVAISLTDRDLNILKRIDRHAIKLTIHGKKGEMHFLSASQQDASMTAQHCSGGLSMSGAGAKITFRYRLERESNGESPVLIERMPDTEFNRMRYGPLHSLQLLEQPFCYTTEASLVGNGQIHSLLTRKG
ncbi:MAG: hypothetical protein QOI13_2346 [Paraburkholderia sp.]|jgi:hypothetical protein|nr:hypothetical protein [Paraburkholderia sp.]